MKAVIFAGGVGTRLWPLSRKKSPKQFEKIVGNKSTLQLSVELLYPEFASQDIYIATGKEYVQLVSAQLPQLPKANIIGEPTRRDVGPAVAFWMAYLAKKAPNEPVVVLWSDHLIRNKAKFKAMLRAVDLYLQQNPQKIVYFGHKPRFASENLGWIETGKVESSVGDIEFRQFKGFRYRPDAALAQEYFTSGKHSWNLGSFATTPGFLLQMFQKFAPKIYQLTQKIVEAKGASELELTLKNYYHLMPDVHLDRAISEKIASQYAVVIVEDIGWSDVGAWEALKEALQKTEKDNVTQGKAMLKQCTDNLIYNYNGKQLVVGIDLQGLLVVNTNDVLLISKKTSVPKIKKLVESFAGTENEVLT